MVSPATQNMIGDTKDTVDVLLDCQLQIASEPSKIRCVSLSCSLFVVM